jgi:hypothetical protein
MLGSSPESLRPFSNRCALETKYFHIFCCYLKCYGRLKWSSVRGTVLVAVTNHNEALVAQSVQLPNYRQDYCKAKARLFGVAASIQLSDVFWDPRSLYPVIRRNSGPT